jgi:hypothetical protein
MDKAILALLIGLAIALVFGYYVAQRSSRHDKIFGGTAAKAFHYIAATAIAGILPVVLASLILGLGFSVAFPLALAFLATGWIALLLYAMVERAARMKLQPEDRGWTREDARKSY